jgi:hypothetical protein
MSACAVTAAFTDPAQAACAVLILGLLLTASVVATRNHASLVQATTRDHAVLRPTARPVDDDRAARRVVNRR